MQVIPPIYAERRHEKNPAKPVLTMNEEAHNPELVDGTGGPMQVSYVQESKLEDTLDPKTYKALEQRTRLKLDIQLVPLCLLLYFLSFLDRTNIAQAQLMGMNGDLHLSEDGHDYAVALTVLFPLYIALEIPSNLVLRFIGARIWIPLLVVSWGISTLDTLCDCG